MRSERETLDYAPDSHPTVSRAASVFSLLGGGVAWLLHLLGVYVIGEFGCVSGWGEWIVGGISMVSWLLFVVTLLTGLLGLAATLVAWRVEKLLQGAKGNEASVLSENQYFVARLALGLNGIFVFIILTQAVPIFYFLKSC